MCSSAHRSGWICLGFVSSRLRPSDMDSGKQAFLEPQGAVPRALTLSVGARLIAWYLRHPSSHFWKHWVCVGHGLAPCSYNKKRLYLHVHGALNKYCHLYWVTAYFIFVSQLDTSWNRWVSKCYCYYYYYCYPISSPPPMCESSGLCGEMNSFKPTWLCGSNLDNAQAVFYLHQYR